jgi:hypothetical protein
MLLDSPHSALMNVLRLRWLCFSLFHPLLPLLQEWGRDDGIDPALKNPSAVFGGGISCSGSILLPDCCWRTFL